MNIQIRRTKKDGMYETRVITPFRYWWASGNSEKSADTGLIYALVDQLSQGKEMPNDYTCPRCKGSGKITKSDIFAPYDCDTCKGGGRLPDRRAKILSDRRSFERRSDFERRRYII